MSVEAAYIRASRSSHLEWKIEVGDVDRLVAAGLVTESLATRLIRLRAEFDSLAGGDSCTVTPPFRADEGPLPRDTAYPVPKALLRGFAETKTSLLDLAMTEAARRGGYLGPELASDVAMKVLDLFLDPNCPMCEGRGFTGAYGSPQIRCRTCRESGARRAFYRTDAEQHFAAWLDSAIDSKVTRALQEMQRLLRG